MNGAQLLVDCLQKNGVTTIFGMPGGQTVAIYDALHGHPDLRHVLVRNEHAGASMADGFARATGRPGEQRRGNIANRGGQATFPDFLLPTSAQHMQRFRAGGLLECRNRELRRGLIFPFRKRNRDANKKNHHRRRDDSNESSSEAKRAPLQVRTARRATDQGECEGGIERAWAEAPRGACVA